MRKAFAVAALAAFTWSLTAPDARACGDKLLSIARGARLKQTYKAAHPATLLMYVGDASASDSTRERSELVQMSILYMSLRQAGHTVEVAQRPAELDAALRESRFQFVLAAPRHMELVDRQLASAPEKPSVLPVLFKPGKSDLVAAERQYPLVLKIPATSTDHLEGIERLMKSRSRSTSGI
jgi:hypothetical protein